VHQYDSDITSGKLTSKAYIPSKLNKATSVTPGIRLDGKFSDSQEDKTGSMVILAVRDKTLKVYTESADFLPDFNNVVLTSLTFSP